MAHDVFISYSVKDKTTADAICATLEANGIRVWIAPRDVMPGSDWGESIIEAIEQSKVMILVFSANSNASPQIKREIERSVNKGVTVVPFRIDDILPSKTLEYFISTQHWLDAFTPPLEKHLDNLVSILRSIFTKQGGEVAAPRLKPSPPEEDEAPAHPAPPVAPVAPVLPVAPWLPVLPTSPVLPVLPVLPVAHNAGRLWGRNAFSKHPGVVTMSIGKPIVTQGRKADEINARLFLAECLVANGKKSAAEGQLEDAVHERRRLACAGGRLDEDRGGGVLHRGVAVGLIGKGAHRISSSAKRGLSRSRCRSASRFLS